MPRERSRTEAQGAERPHGAVRGRGSSAASRGRQGGQPRAKPASFAQAAGGWRRRRRRGLILHFGGGGPPPS